MRPMFTVVVPAYNAGAFVEIALDSVLSQTIPDYEIVVIDDGSTDNTSQAVARWAESHPATRLWWRRQPNRGIAASRNAAIQHATGDFLAFLDADDAWRPGKLNAVRQYLAAQSGADVVAHDAEHWDGHNVRGYMSCGPHSTFRDFLFRGNCLITSATVVRRVRVLEAGGFTEDRRYESSEDYDLWLKLARAGSQFAFIHEAQTLYRTHSASATSNIDLHCTNACNVIARHFRDLNPANPMDRYRIRRLRAGLFRTFGRRCAEAGEYTRAFRYLVRSFMENPLCLPTHFSALRRHGMRYPAAAPIQNPTIAN